MVGKKPKLTREQVEAVRQAREQYRIAKGYKKRLAAEFGVSVSCIGEALKLKHYA